MYFHVHRDEELTPLEELEDLKPFLDHYKAYKSGFINGSEGRPLNNDTFLKFYFARL